MSRSDYDLDATTSPAYGELLEAGLVVLLPVGSLEPHGPHLGLATDTAISHSACEKAVSALAAAGITARIAPAIPYGVTDCAEGFPGAVSVAPAVLTAFLGAVVDGFLGGGAVHVCLVNNHLEPAHDRAVRAVREGRDAACVSVACPLTRRWARTLSPEFKSGACHAGRYETSIVLAGDPDLVDEAARSELPEVPISLSENLAAGVERFRDMGLERAYAGDPAAASAREGEELLERLAEMIAGEVRDALA